MPLRPLVPLLVIGLIAPQTGRAAQPPQPVTWAQMQTAVSQQKLSGKTVVVELSNGDKVSTSLLRVEPEALIVESRPTMAKQWTSAGKETAIPRKEVAGVEFKGRQGKKGRFWGLIGLAVGSGVALALFAGADRGSVELDTALTGALIVVPAASLAGYLAGRAADQPLPHYRIVP